MSQTIPNSSILRNNHELKSIMVNQGQIHEEVTYFQGTLRNLIKADDELR